MPDEFGIFLSAAVNIPNTGVWFLDDPGNELSFEGETASVADRTKLMITGAKGKISILGLATTYGVDGAAGTAISVEVRAVDGGMQASQRVAMFDVTVDAAPTPVGTIGNRGAKEGGMAFVDDVLTYFTDDRAPEAGVTLIIEGAAQYKMRAWSSDSKFAVVRGNPTNSRTHDILDADLIDNSDAKAPIQTRWGSTVRAKAMRLSRCASSRQGRTRSSSGSSRLSW